MFKFKNPDSSETKSKVTKKNNPKFKNDVNKKTPWQEWVYRLFMLLAFLSISLLVIYLGAAGSGMMVGYFSGAIGIDLKMSAIEMLEHINLYSLLFCVGLITFFMVLILWLVIKIITLSAKWLIAGKIKDSFNAYKKSV
jgi:hypothetical protein